MAYAAVVSLKVAMLRISESKNLLSGSEGARLLYDELRNLDSFLEKIADLPSIKIVDDAADSERRVKDAAQHFEYLIDSHLSDLLTLPAFDQSERYDEFSFFALFSQQLPIIKEELTSFLTTLKVIESQQQQTCRYSSSSDYNIENQQQNLLVGLDDQIESLKKWILDPSLSINVKSVVGMTGIGKTSLVKQVYNDPLVVDKFDTRLFVQIGPHYTRLEDIMRLVLDQLGAPPSNKVQENKKYLSHQLWDVLSSKKCLIVLENVWADVLHELMQHGITVKGSRIIIISQIQSMYDLRHACFYIVLPFLKEEESWKLLRQTAFSTSKDENCSRELEKIGKKIARNCEGLPAAIIQVGENLRGKSIQEWEALSEKEDPLVITRDDDTPLSKALHFSYMMLPQKLKTCFMYMGVFPKNYGISRSKLIKLWLSEGLVDPYRRLSSLEETAGRYLDLLICLSVVLREKEAFSNVVKTKNCRLHFTFRSLCVSEAKSEKFFHILKKYTDCEPENIKSQKRLCIHNNVLLALSEVHEWMESGPDARSLLCLGPKHPYPMMLPLHFRLLKILDALSIRLYEFPHQILSLVLLKYLAIMCDGELPNSISRLLNLEVLIVSQHHNIKLSNNPPVYLPIEIWSMHKLKQLYCMGFDLPPPPPNDSHLVLKKLIILSGVSVRSCTVEVLSRIPNLKRIAVQIESAHDSIETFSFFDHFATRYDKFESFKCIVVNPNLSSQVVRCVPKFPANITKISLSGCGLPWKNIGVIAALPHLAVLKLRWYAFCGPHWIMSDGQFPRLQFLLLEDLDLEQWESEESSGSLDHVIVRHCYKLENIPDLLKFTIRVEVDDCSISSVKKICNLRSNYYRKTEVSSSLLVYKGSEEADNKFQTALSNSNVLSFNRSAVKMSRVSKWRGRFKSASVAESQRKLC